MRQSILHPNSVGNRVGQRAIPIWILVVFAFALLALLAPRGAPGDEPQSRSAGGAPAAVAADAAADLDAIQRAFESVAARVSPSVVGIRAKRRCTTPLSSADALAGEPLEQLVIVNGSGVVVRDDGAILTNEHVVQAASDIEVLLSDGASLPATILAADPRSDLAILRVARRNLPVATFCDWSRVARGQWILTLGNPYGLGGDGKLSVSTGVISNLDRRLPGLGESDDRLYADMLQITAPIVPGNSGGPLFNVRGELIGIVTAMHTRSADDQGVGFAIPMTPARRRIVERLLDGDSVAYGYIGITIRTPNADSSAARGAAIESLDPDGPAARAALRAGDLITQLDGQPVESPAQLAELVGKAPIGKQIELRVARDGRQFEVAVAVEPRRAARIESLRGGAMLWRGMRLSNLARNAGPESSDGVVVIDVVPGAPAARADIRVGDVIERIEEAAVGEINAFRERVRDAKGVVQLRIRGRGVIRIVEN